MEYVVNKNAAGGGGDRPGFGGGGGGGFRDDRGGGGYALPAVPVSCALRCARNCLLLRCCMLGLLSLGSMPLDGPPAPHAACRTPALPRAHPCPAWLPPVRSGGYGGGGGYGGYSGGGGYGGGSSSAWD